MTIAILTDGIYPFTLGGIQKHSYYLAKYWARKGIKVHIFHPNHYEEAVLKKYFTDNEFHHVRFHYVAQPTTLHFPGHYIVNSYRFSKALYKAIKNKNFDCIYAQGFTSWYTLIKLPRHPELISNLHGLNMFQRHINLKNRIQLLALQIPARSIIQNSASQISLGGHLTSILYRNGARSGTVHEVPNAISSDWLTKDIIHPYNVNNGTRRFVFIGRYERLKGIEEIQLTLKQLIKEKKSFEFHFIGPIPQSKSLNSNNILANSPINLIYHGTIQNEKKIQGILRDADVLVCPSWSEGMPTVILEAMANGCAIIATDVGAVSEQVDATNGILIEPGNKKQLKNAFEKMLAIDCETLQTMKKASVERIKKKFLWEQVAERTIEKIRQLAVL